MSLRILNSVSTLAQNPVIEFSAPACDNERVICLMSKTEAVCAAGLVTCNRVMKPVDLSVRNSKRYSECRDIEATAVNAGISAMVYNIRVSQCNDIVKRMWSLVWRLYISVCLIQRHCEKKV